GARRDRVLRDAQEADVRAERGHGQAGVDVPGRAVLAGRGRQEARLPRRARAPLRSGSEAESLELAPVTTREAPDFADLDDEREVDVRKYWNALVARWWLPVIGVVAGLIVGYLFTLGGNQVYQATATLYLGQPYSGNSPLQGLATNPTYVSQVIHSQFEARKAAAAAGLRTGQVKNNVSTQTIAGAKGALKSGQTPLVSI